MNVACHRPVLQLVIREAEAKPVAGLLGIAHTSTTWVLFNQEVAASAKQALSTSQGIALALLYSSLELVELPDQHLIHFAPF